MFGELVSRLKSRCQAEFGQVSVEAVAQSKQATSLHRRRVDGKREQPTCLPVGINCHLVSLNGMHILILSLQPVGRKSVDAATATVIAATISAVGGVVLALIADSSKRNRASEALKSTKPSIPLPRSSSVAEKTKPTAFGRLCLNIALIMCAIFYVLSCVFAASFFSLAIFQEPGFLIMGPIVGLLFGLISVAGFSSQIDFES
jgi:hypothetical protein